MPASAAILRPGQRVLVQAQGQQAIAVRFVVGNRNGRRGGYYAPRGRSVMPANRTAQAARASSVAQQIAKANRSAPRHSVAAQRPAHTVPKKR